MRDPHRPDITVLPDPPLGGPRLKRLRLAFILFGLSLLAMVSLVFGMMMAVASDLPELENREEFKKAQNSLLLDANGNYLATLSHQGRIIVPLRDISLTMQHAIIAIEDRRFYENDGVDIRGIGRALWADLTTGRPTQGGSTITQQFVKNATRAQNERTVFEKLREAALAYHLTRKWPKKKILREYLNAIYFGNGAYGIESAARTYFGSHASHLGCGSEVRRCADELEPHEAALLAGMVASPTAYDPVANRRAAKRRRDIVLEKMFEQGYLTHSEHETALAHPVPPRGQVQPPRIQAATKGSGYFTTWVRQQLIDRYGARRAIEGGLRVHTTLDLAMQSAAEEAINRWLANPAGPQASLVAIDNETGEVRAMVGGRDYTEVPFNLATQGQRQPGSAFKPFVLATALRRGISPSSTWTSKRQVFRVPNSNEKFTVNNYDNLYSGTSTLERATTFSDNSVYAQVGIRAGTRRIARTAERMGIRTPVSTNYAITLGGLMQGVTPLDLAHAYETFATGGLRVSGSLGTSNDGPVGIKRVSLRDDPDEPIQNGRNKVRRKRVLAQSLAENVTRILESVIKVGTARDANLGAVQAWGKTGTTENFGDAWFVGATGQLTVAVWVGYPNTLRPMKTEYQGSPVAGGTYPAHIWRDFMLAVIEAEQTRLERSCAKRKEEHPDARPTKRCIEAGLAVDPDATPPPPTTGAPGDGQQTTGAPAPQSDRGGPATPGDRAPDGGAPDAPAPPTGQPPVTPGGGATPGGTRPP